jgi:hypothetical protein
MFLQATWEESLDKVRYRGWFIPPDFWIVPLLPIGGWRVSSWLPVWVYADLA